MQVARNYIIEKTKFEKKWLGLQKPDKKREGKNWKLEKEKLGHIVEPENWQRLKSKLTRK